MATTTPFNQLTGILQFYLAPKIEPEPAANATPAGNWVLIGPTDGDQVLTHGGAATFFRDNDHTLPTKGVRPEEDIMVAFTVVALTLENYAKLISTIGNLSTAVSPNTTKLPLMRGQTYAEYSMLLKGAAMSPYGVFPAQFYVPRCIQTSEPTPTFGKGGRPGLDCEFHVLADDTQSANDIGGWFRAQTS